MWRSGDWYDTMEVCLNGHQITEYAESQPQSRQPFCSDCGAKTIDTCQACNQKIRGYRHIEGVFSLHTTPPPKYCIHCGAAYPWQEAAIENLTDLLTEGELTAAELEEAKNALPDILKDTPRTPSASLKFKRILGKLGKPVYDLSVKVISDIASETAKKTLFG